MKKETEKIAVLPFIAVVLYPLTLPPLSTTTALLPPSFLSAVHTHLAPFSKPFSDMMAAIGALVAPLVDRFTAALLASPDVVFLGVVLALLWLTLQVLSWVRRVIIFWTRVAFNLALVACLGALLAIARRRGPEQPLRDCVVVITKVAGFAVGVGGHVSDMVRRYEEDERATRSGRIPRFPAADDGARWR